MGTIIINPFIHVKGIAIPNIGDNVFGGYFAGVIDTTKSNIIAADVYQTGRRYLLILAPKSLEVTINNSRQWKNPAANFNGAKTRWDGLASTQAMAAASSQYEMANYVSGLSYPSDGHSQWYIPAMDELELLYRNFKPTTTNNATSSDNPTFPGSAQVFGVNPSSDPVGTAYTTTNPPRTGLSIFQSGNAQAFPGAPNQTIASSSWASNSTYWAQDFGDGWQFDISQTQSSNMSIRPVRRVYLDT